MTHQDEQRLQAWMDDELTPADRDAFAERLRREPQLRRQAEALQSLDSVLRQAYDPLMTQVLPPLRIGDRRPRESAWTLFSRWLGATQPLRWQPLGLLLLTTVLLAGGSGYWLSQRVQFETARQAGELAPRDRRALQLLVDRVLEHQRSGSTVSWQGRSAQKVTITPVRTFRTDNGQYCREFNERLALGTEWREERVIACREGEQRWDVKARYFL